MREIFEKAYQFDSPPAPEDIMIMFQDIADLHSIDMRCSRDELMAEHNGFWMLVRSFTHLDKALTAGEYLLRTWHRGAKGIIINRDFEIYSGGELVGEGLEAWVIADFNSKKMLRPSTISSIAVSPCIPDAKTLTLSKLRAPEGVFRSAQYKVTCDDIDVNGHMNNCRYAFIISQALGSADIAELQINYVAECFEGDTLELLIFDGGERTFVHGQDTSGNARFEASAVLF